MAAEDPETEALLRDAGRGDEHARQMLMEKYRRRLRRAVALRLDRRIAARVDPSDIVQEALADAARKLDDYLRDRPLPFYPWLRHFAWECLVHQHRRHLHARRRSVDRERPVDLSPNGESALLLADRLVASGTDPVRRLLREEGRVWLKGALDRLSRVDREILVMRYLEGLSSGEIAASLGISEGAAKVRRFRALERLRKLLEEMAPGDEP